MTVTLTYDDTNARVVIDADDFSSLVENVMIERSTDQVSWTTVRGAVELAVNAPGGITGYADYEFSPCEENFYRVSAVPPGLYLAVTGGYASTPDTAVLDITTTIDIRAEIKPVSWTPSSRMAIVGKWLGTGGQQTFIFNLETNGRLSFWYSTTGANSFSQNSTEATDPPTDGILAVRVTRNTTTGDITFYTSDSIDGVWTQLGAVITTSGATHFSSSANLTVGAIDNGASFPFQGTILAVEVRDGINGTVVADPDFYLQDHQDTSFVDDAGRTWTMNGTASIETTQGPVSVTPNLTKVWIKSLTRPFMNIALDTDCAMGGADTELLATGTVQRSTRAGVFPVINRTFPVAVTDLSLGRSWSLRLRTWSVTAHRALDFLFASGDVLLIQAPCGTCEGTTETGYVLAFSPTYQRHRRYRTRVVWDASVVEVAIPSADIAYAEATWATVIATYGSWSAVIAAHSSWASVLALLPSPEEVIVP